ncbi:MAG TPA: ferredoxin [Clostridiales bacterium]|jgi:ferredoxin|nr:ferredoxin [Clostridiales bacterium]
MKAYVDQDGCISCGLCIDVCPEVFSYNDDGVSEPIEGDIPKDCIERAEEARDGCPTEVISLEE